MLRDTSDSDFQSLGRKVPGCFHDLGRVQGTDLQSRYSKGPSTKTGSNYP